MQIPISVSPFLSSLRAVAPGDLRVYNITVTSSTTGADFKMALVAVESVTAVVIDSHGPYRWNSFS